MKKRELNDRELKEYFQLELNQYGQHLVRFNNRVQKAKAQLKRMKATHAVAEKRLIDDIRNYEATKAQVEDQYKGLKALARKNKYERQCEFCGLWFKNYSQHEGHCKAQKAQELEEKEIEAIIEEVKKDLPEEIKTELNQIVIEPTPEEIEAADNRRKYEALVAEAHALRQRNAELERGTEE